MSAWSCSAVKLHRSVSYNVSISRCVMSSLAYRIDEVSSLFLGIIEVYHSSPNITLEVD